MEYRHLGRLGLKVSPLCLGTMNFGPQTSEPDSHAIMDRALELGINFFDTANVYGQRKGVGATETIVGNWFAKGDGRRDKVVLATKVYSEMGSWPNESRLSALHIRKACEDSLRRLQTDHIDIYQMHHVYREATWDEIWQAFETLVQQGKVHLRRLEQLRRLAHRQGERGREGPSLPRARVRAVHLQPRRARRRARGAPRVRGLRDGRDPLEPAVARAARRRARRRRREGDAASVEHGAGQARGAPAPGRGVREVLRRARRSRRRRSRSPGCSRTPWSRRRSSARGSPSSSRARCARST